MTILLHPGGQALDRYADQALGDHARARVARHLEKCARCRETVAETRELGERARALPVPAVSAAAFDAVVARRAGGERVLLPVADPSPAADDHRRAVALLLAASLLVAVALGAWDRARGRAANASIAVAGSAADSAGCAPSTGDGAMHAIRRALRLTSPAVIAAAAGCAADRIAAPPIRAADASRIRPVALVYASRTVTDSIHTSARTTVVRTIEPATVDGRPAWRVGVRSGVTGANWTGGPMNDVQHFARADLALLRAESRWKDWRWVTEVGADDTARATFSAPNAAGREWRWRVPRDSAAIRGPVVLVLAAPALPLRDGWSGRLLTLTERLIARGGGVGEVSLRVEGAERIAVAAGSFDCWRVSVREMERPARRPEDWSVFVQATHTIWVDRRTGWIVRDVFTRGRGDNTVDVIEELVEARPLPAAPAADAQRADGPEPQR